jgi:hypothetical protein
VCVIRVRRAPILVIRAEVRAIAAVTLNGWVSIFLDHTPYDTVYFQYTHTKRSFQTIFKVIRTLPIYLLQLKYLWTNYLGDLESD